MKEFCLMDCPGRGAEGCMLPPLSEQVRDRAIIAGAGLLLGLANIYTAPVVMGSPSLLIDVVGDASERIRVRREWVNACVVAHNPNLLVDDTSGLSSRP